MKAMEPFKKLASYGIDCDDLADWVFGQVAIGDSRHFTGLLVELTDIDLNRVSATPDVKEIWARCTINKRGEHGEILNFLASAPIDCDRVRTGKAEMVNALFPFDEYGHE